MQNRRLAVATGLSPHGRFVASAATAFALLIALAALGDEGSMAYPAREPQGNVRTTTGP